MWDWNTELQCVTFAQADWKSLEINRSAKKRTGKLIALPLSNLDENKFILKVRLESSTVRLFSWKLPKKNSNSCTSLWCFSKKFLTHSLPFIPSAKHSLLQTTLILA